MRRKSKYGSRITHYNGIRYDSAFEAEWARNLDWLQKAIEIRKWERQFPVEIIAYNSSGDPVITVTHRIDFRLHENDGAYTQLEIKGMETTDYKMRRRLLEALWLPDHPDHKYQVVKRGGALARYQ